ncbi:ribonuclease HII [Litoribaculum gwangyangense]|uniref:Uncharacterized protein n=1 Tax=Litoribaculum gwangyangense TaxID=1130722 RepID=A0ABP9BQG6_9FLAO
MRFFYLALISILFFNCNTSETSRTQLINYVPKNTSIIIKSSNIEGLKSSLHNNNFLQELSGTNSYKDLENKLESISYLNPLNDVLICFSKDQNDSLQYSIITKYGKTLFVTDSLPNYSKETVENKNITVTKSTINSNVFYSTLVDSIFIASSSKDIIETIYEKSDIDKELEKMYRTINGDKTCSMILKSDKSLIQSFFIEDSLFFKRFTNDIALDIDIKQNSITINGVTKAKDSSSLLNIFKNTIPQVNQIQEIAPSNCDGFLSLTFDDFKTFKSNLSKFKTTDSIINPTALFDDVRELGVIYEDEKRAIILNSIDIIATKDALLGEQTLENSFREVDINSFSNPNLFANMFSPLITYKNVNMYCNLDNFFVFTDDLEILQNIIANYQNKTTLNNSFNFKNIYENLSGASSLLQVTNPKTLKTIFNKNFEDQYNFNFDNYMLSAIQFIFDTNFAHINAIIKKNTSKTSTNSVSEILNIKLDKDLLNNPQLVTNHITKEKEIVVQDVNNNLYLISNKGEILWKKTLQGPILGSIEQIDIYKNGRLQLVFATPKRIYVIDRNGNDVAPFPGKFNDEITQPLSVFDYDKNKNYRLLVTQGKNILMYNVNAKPVNGFTFKTANANIISQPKHFRMGNKDYICLKTENKLYILDRTGRNRITPKTQYSYSNQPIFLFENTFTTTSLNGELVMVDTKGNVSTKTLNLSEKHYIDTSSKTLVTLSENKLSIKNKTTDLDYGEYSNCKLFYKNDKIYVSITDLQSHKIYLFDSQSKLLDNFPVYGNSSIELDNMDKDRNLEFVTKGESNSIILYQIN